jgi:hypothetical protein
VVRYIEFEVNILIDNILFRVKSSAALHRAFNVDPLYLQHENAGVAIDYMVI